MELPHMFKHLNRYEANQNPKSVELKHSLIEVFSVRGKSQRASDQKYNGIATTKAEFVLNKYNCFLRA